MTREIDEWTMARPHMAWKSNRQAAAKAGAAKRASLAASRKVQTWSMPISFPIPYQFPSNSELPRKSQVLCSLQRPWRIPCLYSAPSSVSLPAAFACQQPPIWTHLEPSLPPPPPPPLPTMEPPHSHACLWPSAKCERWWLSLLL